MTVDIGAMIRAFTVPYVEGLFHVNGAVRGVDYDGPELSWFIIGPPFDLEWEYDEYDIMHIDWAKRADLPDGRGSVCCGAGDMGADGFFALLDPAGLPVWVVVMTDSNPFLELRLNGMTATFINNLGNAVEIDLTSPDFAPDAPAERPS